MAMFETTLMPLVIEADLVDSKIDTHFGYPLLSCIAVTSTVCYFVFRAFIAQNQRELPQLSDRSFIFVALLLSIIGSAMLVNYQGVGAVTTIGLTILGISLVIGVKSIIDLYAKIIGVSSILGDNIGSSNEN